MTTFPKIPMCEVLHDRRAKFFSCPEEGKWTFVSIEAITEFPWCSIEIEDFFRTPYVMLDYLAHFSEKWWFDARDFCEMLHRFRTATECYGRIWRKE